MATPESHFHWVGDSNFDFILALVLIQIRRASLFDRSDWKNGAGRHETESFWEESCSSISVIGEKGRGGRWDLNGGFHGFTPKRPHALGEEGDSLKDLHA